MCGQKEVELFGEIKANCQKSKSTTPGFSSVQLYISVDQSTGENPKLKGMISAWSVHRWYPFNGLSCVYMKDPIYIYIYTSRSNSSAIRGNYFII